jgi:oxepin-CoA hydrolase / 3-oxo-5,6-dehydrosuberyl-CoA semialdehyde dehydrogenase
MILSSYAQGRWVQGTGKPTILVNAATAEPIAEVTSEGLDFKGMLEYARGTGGPPLRRMTFHQRAWVLKDLARFLDGKKEELYALSAATGATRADSWLDIDGGITTLFVYSSKARRELPDETFHVEGATEVISRKGTFLGQHVCVPLEGAVVHINAFNFPCWGMLEKFAPTFLAGVPAIIKPATPTCYLTHRLVELIVDSGILPQASLQLICGGVGDLFEHLTCQDAVTFTGSSETGRRLTQHPNIVANAVRFNLEADSLNFCLLGPDALPETPEFDFFIKEVAREMTVKAGQKCTAIRRTLVPAGMEKDVIDALSRRLDKVTVGDPVREDVRMGPLAGRRQVKEVAASVDQLRQEAELVYGDRQGFSVLGDKEKGAFFPPLLFYAENPFKSRAVHEVEAFGPVNSILPYSTLDEGVELARSGRGSLVGSVFTADDRIAREVVLGVAPFHGRLMVINRDCAGESTGHGSPLPHLVHGGPGRAGGGEELGGVRGILHFMQRTALQGSPTTLSRVSGIWKSGSAVKDPGVHPFRKHFEDLQVGDSLLTHRRTVTETDVVNFAGLSGDHFYAHTDEIAARESIFGKRVAHGYLLLAIAAGLFVDPAPGPVLANYGLDNLRFAVPVYIGDSVRVRLTCKQKTPKTEDQGIISWDVLISNQNEETVATYTLLTLVRRLPGDSSRPSAAEAGQAASVSSVTTA